MNADLKQLSKSICIHSATGQTWDCTNSGNNYTLTRNLGDYDANPALYGGMRIIFKSPAVNTGAVNITISSGVLSISKPLIKNGSALSGGELLMGRWYELVVYNNVIELMGSADAYTKPEADARFIQTYLTTPTEKQGEVIYVSTLGLMVWNGTKYVDAAIYTKFSDFISQKSTSGYLKLPGGLILQWCAGAMQNLEITQIVNFPIAFPNSCNFAMVSTKLSSSDSSNNANAMFQMLEWTNSTTTVYQQFWDTSRPLVPYVLAIGH